MSDQHRTKKDQKYLLKKILYNLLNKLNRSIHRFNILIILLKTVKNLYRLTTSVESADDGNDGEWGDAIGLAGAAAQLGEFGSFLRVNRAGSLLILIVRVKLFVSVNCTSSPGVPNCSNWCFFESPLEHTSFTL